jgi:alpha-galactosidase
MAGIKLIELGWGAAIRAESRAWYFALNGEDRPVQVEMPALNVDGGEVRLDRVDAVYSQDEAPGRVQVLFATPEVPELKATLDLHLAEGHAGVRLWFTLTSKQSVILRSESEGAPFLRVQIPDGASLMEHRIGDFDPTVHSYRPRARPADSSPKESLRLVGPIIHVASSRQNFVVAHEGPVEAETTFWSYQLDAGGEALDVVAEAGAMLSHQDIGQQPWRSETFQLVVAPSEAVLAFRRFFGALAAPAGEHDVSYNTWHRQELSHHVEGVPYLTRINPHDLSQEMTEAADVGVRYFTVDVGWFEKSGDWQPHPTRFAGGVHYWAREARSRGMGLGLWLNPMVAGLTSRSLETHMHCRMTYNGRPLDTEPIWETEHSAPMCLASDWVGYIEEVLVRLATDGVEKVKFDGLWPASYEWAGRSAVYECDSPHHHHGSERNSPDERRARYRYLAATAVTRLSERASQLGITVELDITESWRFPRLGQLMFGRLFLINNGPYFHDLGVPSGTSIQPNTFNAVFYPHPTHSRIQRTAGLFSEFLPVGRIFGHVLLGDDAPGTMESAITTAAITGMSIWGDLSRLTEAQRQAIRKTLLTAGKIRQAMRQPRTTIDGFVGSSPEVHVHVDDATGKRIVGLFTHQPVTLRPPSGTFRAGVAPHEQAVNRREITLGNDGARLLI